MTWLTEQEHENIIDKMPVLCVDVLVLYQGLYLVLKRSIEPAKDAWWIPGGRVLKNETLENATKRICKREMGQDVRFIRTLDVEETFFEVGRYGKSSHTVNIITLVEATKDKIKLDETHSKSKWIPITHQPPDANPYIKKVIEGYLLRC